MQRRGAVAVAAAGMALLAPGVAFAAPPPEGAAMSDNLEYLTTVEGTRQVVEGKVDRVRGKDVLVLTGRFGFKTLDVSDPDDPKPLDSFLPDDLEEGGYWQNEDMELDTRRKLIIGALDPRHTEKGATDSSPCPPRGGTGNPNCRSGFYVISYADPGNLRQVGDFVELPSGHTTSCIQRCRYIWTGGPARRNNPEHFQLGPILGPNEPAPFTFDRLVGDGRPIWVTDLSNPEKPEVSDQPIDLWRNDGSRTTHTTSTRTSRASPGSAAAAASAGTRRAAGTAIRTRTTGAGRPRSIRSWSPAAASAARTSR